LTPLSADETTGYVRHRLRVAGATAEVFTPGALREVHRVSGGVPRIVNVVADRALLGAFTREEHRVSATLVRRAASEVYGRPMAAPWVNYAIGGAIAAGVALVGVAIWLMFESRGAARGQDPSVATDATPADFTEQVAVSTASATSLPAPTPAPPPALDSLLVQHGNETTTEAALGKLFALWKLAYDPGQGRGCEQAARQGLECLYQKGSWAQLRTLNRPAILTLTDDLGRTHQVLLTRIDEEHVSLELGGGSQRVPIVALSRYWFGDFLLLWRPPLAVAKSLGPGMRGADVRWLRDSLQQAQGLPGVAAATRADFYDEELTRLVQDFQRQHRLSADGVAGVQTQIVLDTLLNATGSPTIVAAVSGS
jgi:general secretion pathway protein A